MLLSNTINLKPSSHRSGFPLNNNNKAISQPISESTLINTTTTTTCYQSTTFPITHSNILPMDEIYLLSSASVSSCDVEAIESLFCLRGSGESSRSNSHEVSNNVNSSQQQRKGRRVAVSSTQISPKKNENPNSGKRKRCETNETIIEIPSPTARFNTFKEACLHDYLEKAKELMKLTEEEIYSKLFSNFHCIQGHVREMISTKNAEPLLTMFRNDSIKKNLIRMIYSLKVASVEERDELSVRFGRNLARYPILALVITSMRPFRAVSSNDMSRLAKSIGLSKSSNFEQVLEERMIPPRKPRQIKRKVTFESDTSIVVPNQCQTLVMNYPNAIQDYSFQVDGEDSTKSYCSWLLNLTNPFVQ